jgi:hypothetical protein
VQVLSPCGTLRLVRLRPEILSPGLLPRLTILNHGRVYCQTSSMRRVADLGGCADRAKLAAMCSPDGGILCRISFETPSSRATAAPAQSSAAATRRRHPPHSPPLPRVPCRRLGRWHSPPGARCAASAHAVVTAVGLSQRAADGPPADDGVKPRRSASLN